MAGGETSTEEVGGGSISSKEVGRGGLGGGASSDVIEDMCASPSGREGLIEGHSVHGTRKTSGESEGIFIISAGYG